MANPIEGLMFLFTLTPWFLHLLYKGRREASIWDSSPLAICQGRGKLDDWWLESCCLVSWVKDLIKPWIKEQGGLFECCPVLSFLWGNKLESHWCSPHSHSLFPLRGGETYLVRQPGKFLEHLFSVGQVTQEAVSLLPRAEQPTDGQEAWGYIGTLPETAWYLLPVTKPILSSDFLVYFSIGSEYAGQSCDWCSPRQPSLVDRWKEDSTRSPRPWFESLADTLSTFSPWDNKETVNAL